MKVEEGKEGAKDLGSDDTKPNFWHSHRVQPHFFITVDGSQLQKLVAMVFIRWFESQVF
jgi:hypothetical protein